MITAVIIGSMLRPLWAGQGVDDPKVQAPGPEPP